MMDLKALLIGMCLACIEHAQFVREQREPHWRRRWERAMKDAAMTRQLISKVN